MIKNKKIEELQKAIKYNPDDLEAYYLLGEHYRNERLYNEAIKTYERILKKDPEHYGAHRGLSLIYETSQSHRDINRALQEWEKCKRGGELTDQARSHIGRLKEANDRGDYNHHKEIEESPIITLSEETSELDIDALTGEQFEDLIEELLKRMGYRVETTKRTGDGGIDLIVYNQEPIARGKYIVQCKRYTQDNHVGVVPVRDLFGVVHAEKANKGIIITTSYFTRGSKEFADDKAHGLIELIDRDRLFELMKGQLKNV